MTCIFRQAFQVETCFARTGPSLLSRAWDSGLQFLARVRRPDAHSPSARHRLEHHRVADAIRRRQQPRVIQVGRRALDDGNTQLTGHFAGGRFVGQ